MRVRGSTAAASAPSASPPISAATGLASTPSAVFIRACEAVSRALAARSAAFIRADETASLAVVFTVEALSRAKLVPLSMLSLIAIF